MLSNAFGIQAGSPWAQTRLGPGAAPHQGEVADQLAGASPALAALLQKHPRIKEILAKDPAALALMAKAARGGSNQEQVLHLLRETLLTYTGSRRTSARKLADAMYEKQKKIAELKEMWTRMKAYMLSHAKDEHGRHDEGAWPTYDYGFLFYYEEYDGGDIPKDFLKAHLDAKIDSMRQEFTNLLYDAVGVHLADYEKGILQMYGDDLYRPRGHDCPELRFALTLFPRITCNHEGDWNTNAGSTWHQRIYGWLVGQEQIMAADARIEAMCAKAQAELDAKNKQLKNEMTQVSSVGEELRDLSREITSLGKGF